MIDQDTKRKQFNNIIRGIDLVLMNNIVEVDPSVIDNFEGDNPFTPEECEWFLNDGKPVKRWCCSVHQYQGDETEIEGTEPPDQCDFAESDIAEVYQWFAVDANDAEFLGRYGQYITYSDLLDTHFLAITHFGTAWDYVDSMVNAFNDLYHEEG